MPYGGRIEVSEDEGQITLVGHADKYNFDETLWLPLAAGTPTGDLRPAQVQFGLLPVIARDEGASWLWTPRPPLP